MKRFFTSLVLLCALVSQKALGESAGGLVLPPLPPSILRTAPPLPPPAGPAIRVRTVQELYRAAEVVPPGGTILLANGHYVLPRRLDIHTDRVTLRGESGRRELVVLDGGPHQLGELLAIRQCSGVTIADLTVQNVRWNGIKLDTDSGVHQVTIHNCIIHNVWQRGVKGVRIPKTIPRPRDCRIQWCLFYNDRAKSYADDPADTPENFRGNYIGGIDVMFPQNWVISDNVFYGIQGRTRSGRGAIFLWHEAENCIVERNVIVDCDVGIALGNSFKPDDVATHAIGVIARNNFVVRCPESGIVADFTRDCLIAHNTIFDPDNRLDRLIRLVHDNPGLVVANNLLVGPPVRNESPSEIRFLTNVVLAGDPGAFADPMRGELHLTKSLESVVNGGSVLPQVSEDFDGQARDDHPDVGADEYQVPP
ncbi:MAG TPA: right-handed parallel beta-helix repeat-containing protein [Thermogutta sp.]|nr:right-handed parallel beta-helix repeat-containing protein [Thermogutta sp.]HPU07525.1 right-handed parallel beta-helix repeat-containing protein [Thermogutta sp.]